MVVMGLRVKQVERRMEKGEGKKGKGQRETRRIFSQS